MNERESICADIIDEGLVAIVRVPRTELALPLAKALVAGGIHAVELTMTIPNALVAIRDIEREMGKALQPMCFDDNGRSHRKQSKSKIEVPKGGVFDFQLHNCTTRPSF